MGVVCRVTDGVVEVEGLAGEIISTMVTWSELSTVYTGLAPGSERANRLLKDSTYGLISRRRFFDKKKKKDEAEFKFSSPDLPHHLYASSFTH